MSNLCSLCNEELELNISPCTDMSCCGIEHRIQCSNYKCPIVILETYNYDTLIDKWIEIGGSKEDYE